MPRPATLKSQVDGRVVVAGGPVVESPPHEPFSTFVINVPDDARQQLAETLG